MRLQVQVQKDHLERLVERSSPIRAVAELVWNSVDGDATRVDVFVVEGPLGGVDAVRVVDNGGGIPHDIAKRSFADLGDSWKKRKKKSPGGRPLHGEKGEGRFAALAIGGHVEWLSRYIDNGAVREFSITATAAGLGQFELGDSEPSSAKSSGTEVEITNIEKVPKSLIGDDPPVRLAELFALYLLRHAEVQIWFDGVLVDPASVQERVETYDIPEVLRDEGDPIEAELTIIEWKHKVGRELVLCDDNGCALNTRTISFHTPGFTNFSAYLKSDFLRERQGILDFEDWTGELQRLSEATKAVIKEHFRERAAEHAQAVVDQWKEEKVYPFEGTPASPVEAAERQVFDVVALNITEYLPDLAPTDAKAKRATFQILKAAIEQSPDTVRRIVQEVLDLPPGKREELVELLDHVSLASIITANKVVVDRQKFLAGLHVVLYEHEAKKKTKERQHLQKLLGDAAWIFGEEYHLAVDDQALEAVLAKHRKLLGERADPDPEPVLRPDGKQGIVDLMLSRKVRLPRADEYEHLVVELKRPSQRINGKVLQQVEQYAFAVAADERFRNSKVKWVFWALSNDMDEYARQKTRQAGRPVGLLHQSDDPNITIWAKTWNQVLDDANGRMQFYRDQLDLMVTHEEGVQYLQRVHAAHLPDVLKGPKPDTSRVESDAAEGTSPPFRRVDPVEVDPFVNAVPLYDLKIAAGRFSGDQIVQEVPQHAEIENPEDYEWAAYHCDARPTRGLFVAQVVGESMNKRIPNGSYCVWRLHPPESNGKVVLAVHGDIADRELGGRYTVKILESEKEQLDDGTWRYKRITLKPSSTDPAFEPIVLEDLEEGELEIIAELVEVLGG